jgi:hypothetical protein
MYVWGATGCGISDGISQKVFQMRIVNCFHSGEQATWPPPNKGMQLTIKSVTPFAFAKAAPLLLAADPRC